MNVFFRLGSLALLLSPYVMHAQPTRSDPVDVQGWFGTSMTLDLKKKWEVGVDYQVRLQNNLRTYKGSYLSFSAAKMLNKRLGLQAEYRLARVANASFHRFSVGGEYEPKLSVVDLSVRVLFLNNIQDFLDPAEATQQELFWRARLKASIRVNKQWDVYASVEPVMMFGGNSFVDNLRNMVGVKKRLSKFSRLDLSYMYRPDYAKATYRRYFHVVGANLDFRLAPGKKKK